MQKRHFWPKILSLQTMVKMVIVILTIWSPYLIHLKAKKVERLLNQFIPTSRVVAKTRMKYSWSLIEIEILTATVPSCVSSFCYIRGIVSAHSKSLWKKIYCVKLFYWCYCFLNKKTLGQMEILIKTSRGVHFF